MGQDAEARRLAIQALSEAPPMALLRNPIEYIFADHFRHRTLCKALDEIALAPWLDKVKAEAAMRFLKTEFGPHILDEEEDLFPLLRRRAAPEDGIQEVLGMLSLDHSEEEEQARTIVDKLAALIASDGDDPPSAEFREQLMHFAAHERRHLTLENAIVLPLARARLKPDDLRTLGKRMAARRGLNFPEADNVE